MKALWIAVGIVWFVGWTICSYRVFASMRPVPVQVEAESPVPPPVPSSRPFTRPTAPRAFAPEELLAGPAPRPSATRATVRPSRTASDTARPVASPPPTPAVEPPPVVPESEAREEAETCLLCKEPAYSWVERDGRRYGYCLKHQGRSGNSRRIETAGTAHQKQQCLGTTKSGSRCRRKTSDPCGYCYQHKPH
jgi:hypothetical protein